MTMKTPNAKLLAILLFCAFVSSLPAQRITRKYNNVSMSAALKELNSLQSNYSINFVYNELEDFKVTADIRNKYIHDAIHQLIGFYPVKMTESDGHVLLVECTHKTSRRLKGVVVDETGEPLPYANVRLLSPTDSTLIAGGVSNESGVFVVPYEIPKVLLKVSYVGYDTYSRICTQEDVGTVRLQPGKYTIARVTVKAFRPLVRQKEDRTVFDVGALENAAALSGIEVLGYVPRVQITDGEKVSVGNGTAEFYINDRPFSMSDAMNFLRTARATDIDRIEVQTARDASMSATGGLNRIYIFAKTHIGLLATFGNQVRWREQGKYEEVPFMSLFFGKTRWNVYASYNYYSSTNAQPNETIQHFLLQNTCHVARGLGEMDGWGHNYQLGAMLYLDAEKHHRLGWEVNGIVNGNNNSFPSYLAYTDEQKHTYSGTSTSTMKSPSQYANGALYYQWKMKDNSSYLHLWANYNYKHGWAENLMQTNFPEQPQRNLNEENYSTSNANNVSIQADFRRDFGKGWTLQSGGLWLTSDRTNYATITDLSTDYVKPISYRYQEDITAGYISIAKQLGKKVWTKAGIRVENAYERGNDRLTSQRMVDKNFTDWVPTFYISYTPTEKLSCKLNYSRSLNRPSFSQLSSVSQRFTDIMYKVGNPDLKRETSDLVRFDAIYGAHNFGMNFYRTVDIIYDDFKVIDGITYFMPDNLGTRNVWNFDYSFSGKIAPWWMVNLYAYSAYRNIPESHNVRNNVMWGISLSQDFTFKKVGTFSLNFFGNTDWIDINNYIKGSKGLSLSYRRTFLQNRLSLTVSANDIFDWRVNKVNIKTPLLDYHFSERTTTRHLFVSITYTFRNKHKTNTEQMQNRNEIRQRL